MTNRITAHTPLSTDELMFWSLTGHEGLSQPFQFTVDLLSTDSAIDRQALLNQSVTVEIPLLNNLGSRYLNGKVTAVGLSSQELNNNRYSVYQLRLEPDFWPLMLERNQRIFQNQRLPDIIKTLLTECGVNVEDKLTGNYRVWEYCVQYQESTFNYISRLMELEGIYYYFRHELGKHTMVLTDSADQHQPFTGYEAIPYQYSASGGATSTEGIAQWNVSNRVVPGLYSINDYDFRKPNAWLYEARQNPSSPQPGQIDVYDWPGRYVERSDGQNYARIRQEEWQSEHQRISGTSTAQGIAPGYTFTLYNAQQASENREYLTIFASYSFRDNSYSSGGGDTVRQVDFMVIPSDITFRPQQCAPWPKTSGPQTARVVGPQGQSIWTDKYGRIKVQFHWDRLAKGDDTSSCWVRVSSAWAGQGFGGIQIPRVGDEVVIDFINGDPDRPLVIGRVYNEASMPPWSLPGGATQMGFLSRSKDGTKDNANALRFEDKNGSEQVWMHAERDMDVEVENNKTHHVGKNHTHSVGANEDLRVTGNQEQAVKGSSKTLTGGNKSDSVVGQYIIDSGTQLQLVCGSSIIELNSNGTINIHGSALNVLVNGNGIISGNNIAINPSSPATSATAPGDGNDKANIQAAVNAKFPSGE